MAESPNIFERRRDMLTQRIIQRKAAVDQAFGVGQRPYDSRKLTGEEKIAYFKQQSPEKQSELWGQMDEQEQDEMRQNLGG